jgi:hypothetical protein
MSSSLDLFLRRLRDPRWIPHISDYCDHRCERCAFSTRCWTYALRQHEESPDAEPQPDEPNEEEMKETVAARMESWAERHGIDLNDITMDASETKAYEELEQRIHNDPLGKRARHYDRDVWEVLQKMAPAERDGGWGGAAPGSELSNAIGDVWGLALVIGAKTNRAISSFEHNKDRNFEVDPIQSDANGSAKVARLAIAESLAAWEVVQSAGLLDGGLISYLTVNLKQLEAELAERFPHAMAFVRPGFDEEIPGIVRPWSIMPDEDDEEDEEDEDDEDDEDD